jgi:hypothetical protein
MCILLSDFFVLIGFTQDIDYLTLLSRIAFGCQSKSFGYSIKHSKAATIWKYCLFGLCAMDFFGL